MPDCRNRNGLLTTNMLKRRVANMLNGPISSIFLIGAHDTGLTTEELAKPYRSFHLATQSASFIERPNPDRLIMINRAKRVAANLEEYAKRLLNCDATSWWFDPIDLDNQIWVSHSKTIPTPDTWGLFDDERGGGQTPARAYGTSTYREQTTSEMTDLDYMWGVTPRYPLSCWRLKIDSQAKVYEIDGPESWHSLCARYPASWCIEDREDRHILVPDWRAVSQDWDGVHLSFGGWITTEQIRYRSSAGESMMEFWNSEKTVWLSSVMVDAEEMPAHYRDRDQIEFEFSSLR